MNDVRSFHTMQRERAVDHEFPKSPGSHVKGELKTPFEGPKEWVGLAWAALQNAFSETKAGKASSAKRNPATKREVPLLRAMNGAFLTKWGTSITCLSNGPSASRSPNITPVESTADMKYEKSQEKFGKTSQYSLQSLVYIFRSAVILHYYLSPHLAPSITLPKNH